MTPSMNGRPQGSAKVILMSRKRRKGDKSEDKWQRPKAAYNKHMKKLVYLGLAVGSTLGGWLGTVIDKGNGLGAWSLLLGTVGGLAGIWAGYKLGSNLD